MGRITEMRVVTMVTAYVADKILMHGRRKAKLI